MRVWCSWGSDPRPRSELAGIVELIGPYGSSQVVAALERGVDVPAVHRHRYPLDPRPGAGVAEVVDEGPPVGHGLPTVPVRDLSASALEGWS